MTDKLIERMARAICMATAERTGVPSKKRWVDERWKDNKSCAAAALAAHEQYLKENGLVIVPREEGDTANAALRERVAELEDTCEGIRKINLSLMKTIGFMLSQNKEHDLEKD